VEKLGHPWSGTAFWIPASKVSAEATGGWVSYHSMHNFFDGCDEYVVWQQLKEIKEREYIFHLKKKSSTSVSCNCYYVNTTSSMPAETWMA